jgi:hypothetical protein
MSVCVYAGGNARVASVGLKTNPGEENGSACDGMLTAPLFCVPFYPPFPPFSLFFFSQHLGDFLYCFLIAKFGTSLHLKFYVSLLPFRNAEF